MTTIPVTLTPAGLQMYLDTILVLCDEELGRLPDWHNSDDLVGAILLEMALQGKTGDELRAWLHDQPEAVAHRTQPVPPPAPTLPSLETRRRWRGAFCIPNISTLPHGRLWTPAYGTYTDAERAEARRVLHARRYTHVVYNVAGLPYAQQYPELLDDSARVRRDLLELLGDGFVPVVFATDDRHPTQVCRSVRDNADLIPIVVPGWEMNGPLGDRDKAKEEAAITTITLDVREAVPGALLYIHFTAGHGSGSYANEAQWWHDMANAGLDGGLLSQDWDFGFNRPQAQETAAAGLEDTAKHLRGRVGGWQGLDLDNVAFEHTTTATFHQGMSEAAQVAYTDYLMAHAPSIVGFCDGGTVR